MAEIFECENMNVESSLGNTRRKSVKSFILRFIKFNLVGFVVFLVGTVIYTGFFSTFGIWTWLLANGVGSVLQFALISYFNSKKIGNMFNSCKTE